MSSPTPTHKRWLVLAVKLGLTALVLVILGKKLHGGDAADDFRDALAGLRIGWLVPALVAQVAMVLLGTVRWKIMLAGQGVHATYRHLLGSMMIGRYFGAVTPAGLGFQGFRLYDIASRTNRPARAAATVGVEVVSGQLGFFLVLLVASAFGTHYLDPLKLVVIDLGLLAFVSAGVLLLSRPLVVLRIAQALLGRVPGKLQSLVDAICAYQGQGRRLGMAVALSTAIHVGHNFLYFFAARALGVDTLSVGMIFFATSMQILSTFAPITVNGVGVREATAVAFYTSVGVPAVVAALIATVGFVVEMSVSLLGGPIFLLRRASYVADIRVDDPEREERIAAQADALPDVELPSIRRGLLVGFGGGLAGGAKLGAVEGLVVALSSGAHPDLTVPAYGIVAYGILGALVGAGGGVVLAWLGRLLRRAKVEEETALGRYAGLVFAGLAFAIGFFRVRRDVFDEQLPLKSAKGLGVLVGCLVASALAGFVLARGLRFIGSRPKTKVLVSPIGLLALAAVWVGIFAGGAQVMGRSGSSASRTPPPPPPRAGNVLVIVVDTLRADHLPAYGYTEGHTPNLDRFAGESLRFDQHFANASWTRPSFASILTGRYASSHSVMAKDDALPRSLVTLAEAFAEGGYRTRGVVTNYNVTPYFQFDQGFDSYVYMEPEFVLGANDAQAKLLLVQMARRVVERLTPARPGSAYRDAATVNREVVRGLEGLDEDHPFFHFVAYMDPHDPYYLHPYDGTPGYARATHQNPGPEEAERLRGLYDGEIAYWDEQFGRLLDELRRRGLYDELTIVVTADHGEEFMDHGGYWHGTTLYDEQVRVPLLVKLPFGARGGTVVTAWSQSVDLMPSLLRLVGLPAVRGVQGRDDLFDPTFAGTTDVLAEENHEGNELVALRVLRGRSAQKLILANPDNPRGLAPTELYRVDLDPTERVNLAVEQPALADTLRARADEDLARARTGRVERREQVSLRAHREGLEALGYAGGAERARTDGGVTTP